MNTEPVPNTEVAEAPSRFTVWIEQAVNRLAWVIVLIVWFCVGLIFWLITLVTGMLLLVVVSLFGLIAGRDFQRAVRFYMSVLRFWPHGFTIINSAFFSKSSAPNNTFLTRETSLLFAAMHVAYAVTALFLVSCLCRQLDPVIYLAEVSKVYGTAGGSLVLVTLVYLGILDKRTRQRRERSSAE